MLWTAQEHGYDAINPTTNLAGGITSDGSEEFQFSSVGEALDYLVASGGLLTLWKDDVDIGLSIEQQASYPDGSSGDTLDDKRSASKITICVDNTFFRYDRDPIESMSVAKDAQSLFESACEILNADYGYSIDEYQIESFMSGLSVDIHRLLALMNNSVPTFVTWLQYASDRFASYLYEIASYGPRAMSRELSNGIVVQFSDYPWNVDRDEITYMNVRWHELSRHGRY